MAVRQRARSDEREKTPHHQSPARIWCDTQDYEKNYGWRMNYPVWLLTYENKFPHSALRSASALAVWIMCAESKSFAHQIKGKATQTLTFHICYREWDESSIESGEYTGSSHIREPINLNDTSTVFRCISVRLKYHCSFQYRRDGASNIVEHKEIGGEKRTYTIQTFILRYSVKSSLLHSDLFIGQHHSNRTNK